MEQEQAVNLGKEERGGRQLFLRIHIFINVEEVFFLWQCLARGDVAQVLRLCYPERPVELAVLLCTFQSCAFWEAEVNAPPSHHPSLTFSPVHSTNTIPTSPPHIHTYKETHYGFLPGLAGASFGKSSGQLGVQVVVQGHTVGSVISLGRDVLRYITFAVVGSKPKNKLRGEIVNIQIPY